MLKLEIAVGSLKYAQAFDVTETFENSLITNKVTTGFSKLPYRSVSCASFSHPVAVSRLKRIALLLVCLLCFDLAAGRAVAQPDIHVQHQEGEYTLQMNLLVSSDIPTVIGLLTDFNHLDVLSPAIQSSESLGIGPDGETLVKTIIRECVLFFCKTMKRVEKVVIADNGRITAEVVPEHSDFSYGQSEWVVSRLGERVSIRYQSRMVPKFSIPAGIGPLVIKYAMRRELEYMAGVIQSAE